MALRGPIVGGCCALLLGASSGLALASGVREQPAPVTPPVEAQPTVLEVVPDAPRDPRCDRSASFAEMFQPVTLPGGLACPGFTDDLRLVIEDRLSDVRSCTGEGTPAPPGRFDLVVTVGTFGAVVDTRFEDPEIGASRWGGCVSAAVSAWRFTVPEHSDGVRFRLPLRQ